nr:hypothetical protein [Corynebacterium lactis]
MAIAVASTLAMTACTAGNAAEPNTSTTVTKSVEAAGQTANQTNDNGLPLGVIPPREPAQAGDARLGPDGHYDFNAPDFVLSNPCDDPEIMAKLEKLGHREDPEKQGRIRGAWHVGCVLGPDGTGPLSILHQKLSRNDFSRLGVEEKTHEVAGFSWSTSRQESDFGTACFASVQTERGRLGFTVEVPSGIQTKFHEDFCSAPSSLLEALIKGD